MDGLFGEGLLRLFDLRTGSLVDTYQAHGGGITALLFGKVDGLLYSASQDGVVRSWALEIAAV